MRYDFTFENTTRVTMDSNLILITSLIDLKQWVKSTLLPLQKEKAVFLLEGPMGAGKTQMVRFFCELVGISDVSSPTYSIINEYKHQNETLHHVDLYRMQNDDEIEHTGFWEIFNKEKGFIFIEWSSKMDLKRIPKAWTQYQIQIVPNSDSSRNFYLKKILN